MAKRLSKEQQAAMKLELQKKYKAEFDKRYKVEDDKKAETEITDNLTHLMKEISLHKIMKKRGLA